ncbi:MAG: hypothetical protein ACREMJ_02180 [Gemmatimonadales bacterium]
MLSLILTAALGISARLSAQGHTAHRHPSGAKIIMTGILVEPLCHFAQKPTGSGVQACLQKLLDQQLRPALLNSDDSTLYVLHSPAGGELSGAQVRRLVGQSVKVDGTVFPAGNTYLIVVDSLTLSTP